MIDEVIPPLLGNERLDRIVALLADVSRSDARRLIEGGAVTVDGEPAASGKVKVVEAQHVTIDPSVLPGPQPPEPQDGIDVEIVYEDDAIIVVNKPAGLVVHPGAGNLDGTLVNALLARYDTLADVGEMRRPGIVHRLDAGSSGLLVVARTSDAAQALIAQFADHSAERIYTAVVWGHPSAPRGVIDAPIGRSPSNPLRMAVVNGGRHARTEYRVLTEYVTPTDLTRLECQLETGRTHQIRVHLGSIGHPLLGDPVYSDGRPSLGLTRPFLHAGQLAFSHPTSGELVRFNCELAPDLEKWLEGAAPAPPELLG